MKKTAFLLAVLLVISVFAFASCDLLPWGDKECTEHADADGDHVCDSCGATEISECVDQDKNHKCDSCGTTISECEDKSRDHKCDYCGSTHSACKDTDSDHKCNVCGATLTECADADLDHKCDKCSVNMGEHVAAERTHDCDYCDKPASECSDADGYFYCDVCGEDILPDTHERIEYSLNAGDLPTATLTEDSINGRFTISSGTTIRDRARTFEGTDYTKSIKIGGNSDKIKVSVPGNGILSFVINNGSSGANTQFIAVIAPDGTRQDIEFPGLTESNPLVLITVQVTKGDWTLARGKNGGTQDIYYLELACAVEKSEENGFELVSNGTVDYLCGQQLDISGLRLNSTYANGKVEPLSIENVNIDTTLVNMGVSGTYPVTVSYKDYEPITYNVNVYLPESLTLGFDAVKLQSKGSTAGNSVYFNHSFREVYGVGDSLDTSGLSVTVEGSLGDATKSFNVSDGYTVEGADFSSAGEKLIKVSYVFGNESVYENVPVYVVDTAPSIVDDIYRVKVDANYGGAIGAVEYGYNMFTTVQQALDFLADAEVGKQKIIEIAPGYYWEKLEITIPNLSIKGAGADKVTIEWDSIYGRPDASGFVHVTDSTSTVAVRDSAVNCVIEGVTISNYWNSQERMDNAGLAIERALALLVQSDRFIMRDSALLGIQDTLELFTGRQYFENVFISGYTDFIFGTNNTTYFKNCTIHVIDTVKDDDGTAGYLTAFKGCNKGAQDAVLYGAIFDGCRFTADEGVNEGKTAIGRPWGAYAAVAVINSELGAHISKAGFSTGKNERYVSMNANPTDSTVKFVEYNNTGAGAITEEVAGMRFLTADEALLYSDFATIFGTINGGVSWLDPWDPTSTEIQIDDRIYYYFGTTEGTSGVYYNYPTDLGDQSGTVYDFQGLIINAEGAKVAWNQNSDKLNMKEGAFITFSVKANTTVTVLTHSGYGYYTINGVSTSHATQFTKYFAEDTEVVIKSTGDLYIATIILNPNEKAPAEPTLNEIKASGINDQYTVGDEVSLDGLEVKVYFSDNSVLTVTDYTVNIDGVNSDLEGEYEIIISWGEKSVNIPVSFKALSAEPEDPAIYENTTITYGTEGNYESIKKVDYSNITVSSFNADNSQVKNGYMTFMVNANAAVSIKAYKGSQYTLSDGTTSVDVTATSDPYTYTNTTSGTVTITLTFGSGGSNYLYSIAISYPTVISEDTTITFGTQGNYKDSGIDFSGISIGGSNTDNSQIKNGSFSFAVNKGATVTVNGYQGYTSYTLGDGTMTTDEITATVYSYYAENAALITITPVNGNNYFYSISVVYPAEN